MKRIFHSYRILWILGVLLLLVALFFELYTLNHNADVRRFKNSLKEREKKVDKTLSLLKSHADFNKFINSKKAKSDIAFLVYEDKELTYWSNNLINVPEVYESSFYNQALLKLNNGYYAVRRLNYQNKILIGLIPIYYEYSTINSYLENSFSEDLRLLYKTDISFDAQHGVFISNKEGKYLFSLLQHPKLIADTYTSIGISFLFFLGFMLLLSYFIVHLHKFNSRKHFFILVAVIAGLFIARWLMIYFKAPHSLYSLSLLQSNLHASSKIFRSLGDYWINALTVFLSVYILSSFNVKKRLLRTPKKRVFLQLIIVMISAIYLGLYSFSQIRNLVLHSSFSLQIHIGSSIELYAIWGYSGATLFLASVIFFIRAITLNFERVVSLLTFYKIWISLLLVTAIILFFIDKYLILHLLFLSVIGITQGAIRYRARKNLNNSLQVIVIIISAFYLTSLISIYSEQKERQIRLAKAKSITDSNDPKAKALLETISTEWNKDDILLNLYQNPIANEEQIKEYLRHRYFKRNWFNYNVQFFICTNEDNLEGSKIPSKGGNCFASFNQLLQNASRIGDTPFYEITTYKGLSSYIGALSFITEDYGEVKLFIQLELKPYENEQGYLELLVSKQQNIGYNKSYSFAKYLNNKLRYATGAFNYYSLFNIFQKQIDEEGNDTFITLDGYNHYIYSVTDNYRIIVSEKELSLYKKYIAFPYIFFLLLFIFIFIWSLETYTWDFLYVSSFSQQIRTTLVLMITLVFFIVAGASLYYNFSSNQAHYEDAHNEKMKMLRRELFSRLNNAKELDTNLTPELEEKLKDYARILGADINIYDTYGVLLSTSQPEIFAKGLLSYRMNYAVLNQLNRHDVTEITTQERIGNLEYSSVYMVLWNNKNEPIAYLNVPFFMNYTNFKSEMQDIIVGVLNINLLLIILALLIAFAISQRITSPLAMLREKFARIQLGKENEKIHYPHDDEVKGLIDSYNTMVDELEANTKLLTQSERESAWRQMARQVAHEIKNPLTPMKLNLQFLQRKLDQSPDPKDWKERFEESSNMLLNQIDELANIASAFSDFAKMPKIQNEKFDLVALLRDIIMLYNKGEVAVTFSCDAELIYIFADKNRIRRSIINLMRNAIQAMPDFENRKIEVVVEEKESKKVEIQIIDNGKGIPEALRSKIFSPNFTTKNSGMGLGLALTKDSIQQANGEIRFETEVDKGTTFFVTLPVWCMISCDG